MASDTDRITRSAHFDIHGGRLVQQYDSQVRIVHGIEPAHQDLVFDRLEAAIASAVDHMIKEGLLHKEWAGIAPVSPRRRNQNDDDPPGAA